VLAMNVIIYKMENEMPVVLSPSPKDYLACREHYLVAFHRYKNFGESLKERLGVSSDAEMEEAFMDPQTRDRFRGDIQHFGELGEIFDSASTNHDLALELQRHRVAQQQAELNSTIYSMDE
jgi:hypothetical protein